MKKLVTTIAITGAMLACGESRDVSPIKAIFPEPTPTDICTTGCWIGGAYDRDIREYAVKCPGDTLGFWFIEWNYEHSISACKIVCMLAPDSCYGWFPYWDKNNIRILCGWDCTKNGIPDALEY